MSRRTSILCRIEAIGDKISDVTREMRERVQFGSPLLATYLRMLDELDREVECLERDLHAEFERERDAAIAGPRPAQRRLELVRYEEDRPPIPTLLEWI